jgi:hypothetical protein
MSDASWIYCRLADTYWLQLPLKAVRVAQSMPQDGSFYDEQAGTAWLRLRYDDPVQSDAMLFFYALGLSEVEAMEVGWKIEIIEVDKFEHHKLDRFSFDELDFDGFLSSLIA